MKAAQDPRHQKRIELVKLLFAYSFNSQPPVNPQIQSVISHLSRIDQSIQSAAPEWPIDQINKVDLAVLRLAIFELQDHNQPYKVVIDEAVEIAKEYGSESSAKFINGVLGTVVSKLKTTNTDTQTL